MINKELNMTFEKDLKLTIDEIKRTSWKCSSCGNEQILDVSTKEKVGRIQPAITTLKCGICGTHCHPSLVRALVNYIEIYNGITESCCAAFFRISLKKEIEQ